jgi:hypothetical protein
LPIRTPVPKVLSVAADLVRMTVNAISRSSHANQVNQTSQPVARQAQNQPKAQQNSALSQDTVTLSRAAQQGAGVKKSSGDVDHDADSH